MKNKTSKLSKKIPKILKLLLSSRKEIETKVKSCQDKTEDQLASDRLKIQIVITPV